jgi:hypothetical protein
MANNQRLMSTQPRRTARQGKNGVIGAYDGMYGQAVHTGQTVFVDIEPWF